MMAGRYKKATAHLREVEHAVQVEQAKSVWDKA